MMDSAIDMVRALAWPIALIITAWVTTRKR